MRDSFPQVLWGEREGRGHVSVQLDETIERRRLRFGRRLGVLALLAGALGLIAALDAVVAAGPAFGLSFAAAWLVRPREG